MLFWWWACTGDSEPPHFEAVVTHAPGVLPEKFRVDVPPEWTEQGPPLGRVEHQLCQGHPGVREAVAERLASGASSWSAVTALRCDEPEFCAWVRAQIEARGEEARALGSSPWWSALGGCSDEASLALLEAAAPAGVVLSRALNTGRVTPRVREVALQQIRAAADRPEHAMNAWLAVAALGEAMIRGGGEAEAALVEAYSLAPPEQRDAVALHLRTASTEEGKRLFRELCQRTSDPTCAYPEIDPLRDVAEAMRFGLDPERLSERYAHHGQALREALARCVVDAEPEGARRCVLALARLDRQAARSAAEALSPEVGRDLAKVLSLEPDEVLAALAERGLLGQPDEHGRLPGTLPAMLPGIATAVTVPELLLAANKAVRIEELLGATFEGVFGDDEHVRLLYALAQLADLQGVEFDQLGPSPVRLGAGDGTRTFYLTWLAWLGPRRYRTLQPVGTLDGGQQDVGFINALLAASEQPQRLAIADGIALVGTPEQLSALEKEGWVRFTRPAEPAPAEPGDEPLFPPGMIE